MQYDLSRFKKAQEEEYSGYKQALIELQNGYKEGHWIWYIFPQIKGLGKSSTSEYFGIMNLAEAVAYLEDELLSSRLLEATTTLMNHRKDKSAENILGYIDAIKCRSSLTLFKLAAESKENLLADVRFNCFNQALHIFYGGKMDNKTLAIISGKAQ